jgi:GAF domain-containing protein
MPALGHGVRSSLSLPLPADGAVIGVLNTYATTPRAFGPAEQLVARRFADEAFEVLRSISRNRKVKLRDIAAGMVTLSCKLHLGGRWS